MIAETPGTAEGLQESALQEAALQATETTLQLNSAKTAAAEALTRALSNIHLIATGSQRRAAAAAATAATATATTAAHPAQDASRPATATTAPATAAAVAHLVPESANAGVSGAREAFLQDLTRAGLQTTVLIQPDLCSNSNDAVIPERPDHTHDQQTTQSLTLSCNPDDSMHHSLQQDSSHQQSPATNPGSSTAATIAAHAAAVPATLPPAATATASSSTSALPHSAGNRALSDSSPLHRLSEQLGHSLAQDSRLRKRFSEQTSSQTPGNMRPVQQSTGQPRNGQPPAASLPQLFSEQPSNTQTGNESSLIKLPGQLTNPLSESSCPVEGVLQQVVDRDSGVAGLFQRSSEVSGQHQLAPASPQSLLQLSQDDTELVPALLPSSALPTSPALPHKGFAWQGHAPQHGQSLGQDQGQSFEAALHRKGFSWRAPSPLRNQVASWHGIHPTEGQGRSGQSPDLGETQGHSKDLASWSAGTLFTPELQVFSAELAHTHRPSATPKTTADTIRLLTAPSQDAADSALPNFLISTRVTDGEVKRPASVTGLPACTQPGLFQGEAGAVPEALRPLQEALSIQPSSLRFSSQALGRTDSDRSKLISNRRSTSFLRSATLLKHRSRGFDSPQARPSLQQVAPLGSGQLYVSPVATALQDSPWSNVRGPDFPAYAESVWTQQSRSSWHLPSWHQVQQQAQPQEQHHSLQQRVLQPPEQQAPQPVLPSSVSPPAVVLAEQGQHTSQELPSTAELNDAHGLPEQAAPAGHAAAVARDHTLEMHLAATDSPMHNQAMLPKQDAPSAGVGEHQLGMLCGHLAATDSLMRNQARLPKQDAPSAGVGEHQLEMLCDRLAAVLATVPARSDRQFTFATPGGKATQQSPKPSGMCISIIMRCCAPYTCVQNRA